MSTQMKLIIPLLDKCIVKEDLSEESGFIDAYTYNINKPYLDNHIFLMYDTNLHNKRTTGRCTRFLNATNLYGKDLIYVNGQYYTLYVFTITNKDIKNLLKGLRHSKNESFSRISTFWDGSDKEVTKYLCDLLPGISCSGKSVPEEDYLPDEEELLEKRRNPEGLKIDLRDFLCFYTIDDTYKYGICIYSHCL